MTSQKPPLLRAAYLTMDVATRFVIVPASIATLLTGMIQSVGTPWGLVRHYWVLVKLVITVLATAVLILHTQPIAFMTTVAAEAALAAGDYEQERVQLVAASVAALVALLTSTVLAVYKPRGTTPWGAAFPSGRSHRLLSSTPFGCSCRTSSDTSGARAELPLPDIDPSAYWH